MTVLVELTNDVVTRLTPEFLARDVPIDLEGVQMPFPGEPVDLADAALVVEEAMQRFEGDRSASDAWLGPRLHDCLRLCRRDAARRGVWRFLTIAAFPEYVRWRWGGVSEDGEPLPAVIDRFVGADIKNALARLWWMAELFRNGPDYSRAVIALSKQDVTNNLFRSEVAHHRPTALGAIVVLDGKGSDEANALAKAINAAATTLVIDAIAPDPPTDDAAIERWQEEAADRDPTLTFDALPVGPDDPPAPPASVDAMGSFLEQLLEETPLRDRKRTEDTGDRARPLADVGDGASRAETT